VGETFNEQILADYPQEWKVKIS